MRILVLRGFPLVYLIFRACLISQIFKGNICEVSGLELATNMVANATNFFSLATKIFVQSPVWRPEFCVI